MNVFIVFLKTIKIFYFQAKAKSGAKVAKNLA